MFENGTHVAGQQVSVQKAAGRVRPACPLGAYRDSCVASGWSGFTTTFPSRPAVTTEGTIRSADLLPLDSEPYQRLERLKRRAGRPIQRVREDRMSPWIHHRELQLRRIVRRSGAFCGWHGQVSQRGRQRSLCPCRWLAIPAGSSAGQRGGLLLQTRSDVSQSRCAKGGEASCSEGKTVFKRIQDLLSAAGT